MSWPVKSFVWEALGSLAVDLTRALLPPCPRDGLQLQRYLTFFHNATCRAFNVGDYRREFGHTQESSTFFSDQNSDGAALRQASTSSARLQTSKLPVAVLGVQ